GPELTCKSARLSRSPGSARGSTPPACTSAHGARRPIRMSPYARRAARRVERLQPGRGTNRLARRPRDGRVDVVGGSVVANLLDAPGNQEGEAVVVVVTGAERGGRGRVGAPGESADERHAMLLVAGGVHARDRRRGFIDVDLVRAEIR